MDMMETLMSNYPTLSFNFMRMPSGLEGLNSCDQVFIDPSLNKKNQTEVIAEEIAHYETTVGDISDQSIISNRKQETKARCIATELVITLDGLINCFENNILSLTELSDYFEVSEKFVLRAIDFYRIKRGLTFTYKNYLFDLTNIIDIKKL